MCYARHVVYAEIKLRVVVLVAVVIEVVLIKLQERQQMKSGANLSKGTVAVV